MAVAIVKRRILAVDEYAESNSRPERRCLVVSSVVGRRTPNGFATVDGRLCSETDAATRGPAPVTGGQRQTDREEKSLDKESGGDNRA